MYLKTISKKAYVIIRDITRVECPWLDKDFKTNEIVYLFEGNTYNLTSRNGMAYTKIEDVNPFFELPNDATRPFKLMLDEWNEI